MTQTHDPPETRVNEIFIPTPEGWPYELPHNNTLPQEVVNGILVEQGPYFFHAEGSPYLGLTVAEQQILAKLRRPVGRIPKWRLRQLRKATKKDYEKLLLACTEALVYAWHTDTVRLDRVSIYVKLPFNWRSRYDKSIPRAFICCYDDWTVTVSWRVDKLLNWLHEKGHSAFSSAQLRKHIWVTIQEQEKLELYYNVAADQSIIELYGELIGDAETGKVKRKDKGRGTVSRNKKKLDAQEKI